MVVRLRVEKGVLLMVVVVMVVLWFVFAERSCSIQYRRCRRQSMLLLSMSMYAMVTMVGMIMVWPKVLLLLRLSRRHGGR